jgi:hypothetical protein
VLGQTKRFSQEISKGVKRSDDILKQLALEGLRKELDQMAPRLRQVINQTKARIFDGNTRLEGKLLSVFEPSTEVIRKGKAGKPNATNQDERPELRPALGARLVVRARAAPGGAVRPCSFPAQPPTGAIGLRALFLRRKVAKLLCPWSRGNDEQSNKRLFTDAPPRYVS